MKILLKKIRSRKGFTLTECIIAVAVFAAMAVAVMQMLAVTIQSNANNHSIEKNMDQQIHNIATQNELVERNTVQLALDFVKGNGENVNHFDNISMSVMKDPTVDDNINAIEINTFDATITGDDINIDKDKENGAGMVTENIHLYGTKGIESVIISCNDVANADGSHRITLSMHLVGDDPVLAKAESCAFKMSLPRSATGIVVNPGDGMEYKMLSNRVIRLNDKSRSGTTTDFDGIQIAFDLDKNAYEKQWGSFGKYFIDPDSDNNSGATFNDAVTPGIYTNVV